MNILHYYYITPVYLYVDKKQPYTTLCPKKVPAFKFAVTQSNINRFDKDTETI